MARQSLQSEEVEPAADHHQEEAQAAVLLPPKGKRDSSFILKESSSTGGAVALLPAMVPAFSNVSFSGATVIVNFGAGSIYHNTASNVTASNEILQQSTSIAPEEEAAWKKLRQ